MRDWYATRVTVKDGDGDVRLFSVERPRTGGAPDGWAVQCAELLTEPYSTVEAAQQRLQVIEDAGLCLFEHRVVPVWEVRDQRRVAAFRRYLTA